MIYKFTFLHNRVKKKRPDFRVLQDVICCRSELAVLLAEVVVNSGL